MFELSAIRKFSMKYVNFREQNTEKLRLFISGVGDCPGTP
jgi:hypothetical protein